MKKLFFIILLIILTLTIQAKNSQNLKLDSLELAELLSMGEELVKSQSWEKAENLYKTVLDRDSSNKNAVAILSYIKKEKQYKKTYTNSIKLMSKKSFYKAKTGFNSIPMESTYYSPAQKRLDEIFESIITEVDRKISLKRYTEAKNLLTIAKSIKESSVAVSSRVDDINKKTEQYSDKKSNSSKIDIKASNTYNPKSRNQAIKLLEEAKKTAMTNPKATVSKALESIKVDPTYSEAYLIAGFGYKNIYDRTKNQNDKQKAINFFNQYLTLVPNASNKDGVKNIIKTLSK